MKKLRELLRLKFGARLSHRQIGAALNISPGTVSYYSQAALAVGLGWPLPESMDDESLMAQIELMAKQLRERPAGKVEPDWQVVHQAAGAKHMTLQLVWEDYYASHGLRAYSYSHFSRLYKVWRKKQRVTLRLRHQAGEKCFIDYAGTTLPVYCRETGAIAFKAHLFVMALGFSHYTFAYASRSQSVPDWIDCHRRAFHFFGGTPAIWVPDNLKAGITDSCQFEPEANPTYADMASHYQAAIIPARPRKPQDKSIAENAVLISSRWIIARLSKQRFYSLHALNNAIAQLLTALNNKPFQKRQGSRQQQFEEREKAYLQPLPHADFEIATCKTQKVPPDYHVRIDGHYYSVPYPLTGETVLCRYTQSTLEVLHNGQRCASHLRSFERDGQTTVAAHLPEAHRDYQQWSPEVFLEWAEKVGSGVFHVAQRIIAMKKHPEQCSKIHFGLKRLGRQYGNARLNQACRRALAADCVQFKSIRSILEKRLDEAPHLESLRAANTPQHSNLRGADYYQQS